MDLTFPYNPSSIFERNDKVTIRLLNNIYFLGSPRQTMDPPEIFDREEANIYQFISESVNFIPSHRSILKDYDIQEIRNYINDPSNCFIWKKQEFKILVKHKYNRMDIRKYMSDYTGRGFIGKGSKIGHTCNNNFCVRPSHIFEKKCYFQNRKKLKI